MLVKRKHGLKNTCQTGYLILITFTSKYSNKLYDMHYWKIESFALQALLSLSLGGILSKSKASFEPTPFYICHLVLIRYIVKVYTKCEC